MAKVLGYIIALIGLVLMAVSFLKLPLPSQISPKIVLIAGVIVIVIGILMSLGKKENQVKSEVPIYEGQGKNRKIVGYQREKK